MPAEILLEQLAASVRKDLQAALTRISDATPDLVARARLTHAACAFMFGAACGAQFNVTPQANIDLIADSLAADLVDGICALRPPGQTGAG